MVVAKDIGGGFMEFRRQVGEMESAMGTFSSKGDPQ
jgi:hypothetical protein